MIQAVPFFAKCPLPLQRGRGGHFSTQHWYLLALNEELIRQQPLWQSQQKITIGSIGNEKKMTYFKLILLIHASRDVVRRFSSTSIQAEQKVCSFHSASLCHHRQSLRCSLKSTPSQLEHLLPVHTTGTRNLMLFCSLQSYVLCCVTYSNV